MSWWMFAALSTRFSESPRVRYMASENIVHFAESVTVAADGTVKIGLESIPAGSSTRHAPGYLSRLVLQQTLRELIYLRFHCRRIGSLEFREELSAGHVNDFLVNISLANQGTGCWQSNWVVRAKA